MSSLADLQKQLAGELEYVDGSAQIVLKGHLILEGLMTEAIERYVLHRQHLENVRLTFAQKINLCRAISIGDNMNPMWSLVERINTMRNALAHSLDKERREKAFQALKASYTSEFSDLPKPELDEMPEEMRVCLFALSGCLGFLHAFLEEIKQFEQRIVELDSATNKGRLTESKKR